MHNALSDEKLYIEVRIFLSHLLQLSPGISRKQAFHHVQFLIQEKVRYQKAALLFVTKSKKAFSLMSSIAVHPEPAALPTHGLMSRRSTWLNYIQSYYRCK